MHRIRSALLCVLVALAASATGVQSASAAYFVEGTELTTPETIDGVVGVADLNATVSAAKIVIECTANKLVPTGKNELEADGTSSLEITYTHCYFYVINKGKRELSTICRITQPITFSTKGQVFADPSELPEDELRMSINEQVTTVNIGNVPGKFCLVNGSYEVTGFYDGSFGSEGEIEKTDHELASTSTGGPLEFGGLTAAAFINEVTLKLSSGKTFRSLGAVLESKEFTVTVDTPLLRSGGTATVTITNISGGLATVKVIEEYNRGFFKTESEIDACTKTYTKNQTCTWKVEDDKTGEGVITFVIVDSSNNRADKSIVGKP